MKNLKIFESLKKTKAGRTVLRVLAGTATGFTLLFVGAACDPDEIPVQITIEDQNPVNNPDEEEVTKPGEDVSDKPGETDEPEEIKEESNEPEMILYGDDGEFYTPQKVSLGEFYDKVDYANEKYNWKSDWDRDRYVGLLLYNNAYAMEDADIKEVYDDYLGNFGIDILEDQSNVFMYHDGETVNDKFFYYHTYVDFEDYFIDAKLASEAKKFQPVLTDDSNKTRVAFRDSKKEFIKSIDYSNKGIYNIVFEEEMKYLLFEFDTQTIDNFNNNAYIVDESKQKVWNQINLEGEMMGDYQVSEYESSHIEMTK